MASTILRNPHRMPMLPRHLVPVSSVLFWPWSWGRREEQQDQDKHCVLEKTEDNGTCCQESLGKRQAWRETWELDFVAVYLKIRENGNAGRWSRPRKCPSCSGMREGSGYSRILVTLFMPTKAQSFLLVKECLDSCHGRGWDKPRMFCNANESQTDTKVCFITATRRNTPSLYNLNIHKRENILLLFL